MTITVEIDDREPRAASRAPRAALQRLQRLQQTVGNLRPVMREIGEHLAQTTSKGDCWDNAAMASVNGTLKVECVHDAQFQIRQQARQASVESIGCCNTEGRHSSPGNIAPAEFMARRVTRRGAAEMLGVRQSKSSRIARGHFRGVSEAKRLELVTKRGRDVKTVVGQERRRAGKIELELA